jgi:ribosomal protein L12E/L44/L45/RPP1/RPP2
VSEIGPGSASACTIVLSCVHGTGMIDIAAGDGLATGGPNFQGVAPQARIIAVQVYSANSPATIQAHESDVISGLNWVSQESTHFNIAAVNLSFAAAGTSFASACDVQSPALTAAISALRDDNIATVIASGNEGLTSGIAFPACVSSAINVGAVDDTGQVASISNRGPNSMFWAPGVDIETAATANGFLMLTGTSDSAAMVSGAIAVLRSADPHLTVDQIVAVLQATGTRISDPVSGTTLPLVQLDAAINSVVTPAPTPTAEATSTSTQAPSASPTRTGTETATVTSLHTGVPRHGLVHHIPGI